MTVRGQGPTPPFATMQFGFLHRRAAKSNGERVAADISSILLPVISGRAFPISGIRQEPIICAVLLQSELRTIAWGVDTS